MHTIKGNGHPQRKLSISLDQGSLSSFGSLRLTLLLLNRLLLVLLLLKGLLHSKHLLQHLFLEGAVLGDLHLLARSAPVAELAGFRLSSEVVGLLGL